VGVQSPPQRAVSERREGELVPTFAREFGCRARDHGLVRDPKIEVFRENPLPSLAGSVKNAGGARRPEGDVRGELLRGGRTFRRR
jgi:hypothetical protein